MRDGAPVHGHTGLEIFWTAIPTVIVTVFGVWGGIVLHDNEAHAANQPGQPAATRVILATGQQYSWSFTYKTDGGFTTGQLVVPTGPTIEIQTTSRDVIHSFFVPEWRVKQDAVPGLIAKTYVTPTKTGSFPLYCAELCGPGHAQMGLTAPPVKVVSPTEFTTWLASQKQQQSSAPPGKALFTSSGCAGCHTFTPAGSTGTIGPNLDNLTAAAAKAGPKYKTPADYVKTSILDPNAYITPGYQPNIMPAKGGANLSDQQVNEIVTYLLSGGTK
jgi:cytochrome c oxidase subunit 2